MVLIKLITAEDANGIANPMDDRILSLEDWRLNKGMDISKITATVESSISLTVLGFSVASAAAVIETQNLALECKSRINAVIDLLKYKEIMA